MKLTSVLLRFRPKLPKGHIFRGKNKIIRRVTSSDTARQREEFELEERNMFYLRNPYLTPEQEYGHGQLFQHRKKFYDKHNEAKLAWRDHKSLGDRFGFLKVAECWE